MAALLIDFETSGLDTATARILEVGAMVTTDDFKDVIASLSCLVYSPEYEPIDQAALAVNGIKLGDLYNSGVTPVFAFEGLKNLCADGVSEVVAFNSGFDEAILRAEIQRQGHELDAGMHYLMSKPWLCSMQDIESNYKFKSWRLAHLALEYGVTVNPLALHRAISDVELMRQMLIASGTTPAAMRSFKDEPWVYLKAEVVGPWKDGGLSTTEAKKYGYRFERAAGDDTGKEFSKTWVKRVKQRHVQSEAQGKPFQVVELL